MRVVWFDNLETVLTNKDPVLIFLVTNSKKSVLLEGTLMTWLHFSNLNPNSASEFSLLRKEVWENSRVSLSHQPFSLRSFLRLWMCFNISCSNSYWYSVGRHSLTPCPLISPSYTWTMYFISFRPWLILRVFVDLRWWWLKKRVFKIIHSP